MLIPVADLGFGLLDTDHGTRCEHSLSVIELIEHQGIVCILLMGEAVFREIVEESDYSCLLNVDQILAVNYRDLLHLCL